MTILVTGSDGQLGNELRRLSAAAGFSGPAGVPAATRFIFTDVSELDITDASAVEAMVRSESVDVIVNCAAYTNVDKAEDDEATADKINHLAVRNLAEAAKAVGAALIHVSTDYVFDGTATQPYKEDDPVAPLGAYGRTKLAGERAVTGSGCNYIIIRTAWLYSSFGKNFVKTMRGLTSERDSLRVVADQWGSPTFAADLAALIIKIIEEGQLDKQGIYHFSGEGVCTWYDFAVEICRESGNRCDIIPCTSEEYPSRVKRPHYSVLDKSKVKETFGVSIPDWKYSLKRCIQELETA